MTRREIEKQVFIKLVNKQLEPFNVKYSDVVENPNWYMDYKTTREEESKFMNWGVNLIREELNLSKKQAELEMNWFVLQWGLTTKTVEEVETTQKKSKPAKN